MSLLLAKTGSSHPRRSTSALIPTADVRTATRVGRPVTEKVEGGLAAFLSADVDGYSALVRADVEGTLAYLSAHVEDLMQPKIAEHHDRVVKLMGDVVLAESASVVDAVRCAAEVRGRVGADFARNGRVEQWPR